MITTRHKLTRYGTSLAVVLGVHAIAIAIDTVAAAGGTVTDVTFAAFSDDIYDRIQRHLR